MVDAKNEAIAWGECEGEGNDRLQGSSLGTGPGSGSCLGLGSGWDLFFGCRFRLLVFVLQITYVLRKHVALRGLDLIAPVLKDGWNPYSRV